MICQHFRETTESVVEFSHCVSISLRGDDVQVFETKLVEIPLSMMKTPKDDTPESFCKNKTHGFGTIEDHLCTVHSRYSTIESKTPEGRSATLGSRS